MKKYLTILFVFILSLSLLTACGPIGISGHQKTKTESITMGFVPMRDAEQLIESVQPLADLLSEELGVEVKAFTATNYVGVVEGLGSGQVDFGFIPPFAYVLANQENGANVILTALNRQGESNYISQFVVRKDSGINTFDDIINKRVAFVDYSSSSGYLFPAAHLVDLGIDLNEDIHYIITGGHDRSLELVLNGDVDVAATFANSISRYADDFPTAEEDLKVLGETQKIPNISVTVASHVEEEMKLKIQQALINISEDEVGGPLLIELFNMYGFVEATDSDYDVIRLTAKLLDIDLQSQD